jgi:hypothetical protein
MVDIRSILLQAEYDSNVNAITKQRVWRKKQQNIFYGEGRPIFFQKIEGETKIVPYHLWYLNEDRFRFPNK